MAKKKSMKLIGNHLTKLGNHQYMKCIFYTRNLKDKSPWLDGVDEMLRKLPDAAEHGQVLPQISIVQKLDLSQ